jgi:5-methylcytosine-specific restriction enzyme subunit McrC
MPFKNLSQQALVQLAKMPLLEVFIQQALDSIFSVLQRGLKRHYQLQQDNLPVLRGRLLIQQQIRHNHSHQARFYSAHDEYSSNCPENRLLRLALNCMARITRTACNQQLVQACQQRMAHIPASSQPEIDISAIQLDRNSQYYASALQWARLIINGFSPSVTYGQQPAFSLLFDMNKLFENIVASQLKKQLPASWQLKKQQQTAALLQVNNQPQQKLQPDLLLFDEQQPIAVLDSKWKNKSGNTFSQLKPDEQELYQMFAYAAAYLPKGGNVCLIYPGTPQFSRAVEQAAFQHIRDAKVHLWLLPFCLHSFTLVDAPFPLPLS